MRVKLENVGAIREGAFEIKERVLNIKYAPNGTGKSTFASFLQAAISGDQEARDRYVPFGSSAIPDISFLDHTPESCLVFNQDYIDSFLFVEGKEDLLHETHRLIRLTPQVQQSLDRFDSSLEGLRCALGDQALVKAAELGARFLGAIKNENDLQPSINKTAKFGKATKTGCNVLRTDESTRTMKEFIESPNVGKWYEWWKNGGALSVDERCPFCGQNLPDEFSETKEAINRLFDKKNAKGIVEANQDLQRASELIIDSQGITDFMKTETKPTAEAEAALIQSLRPLLKIAEKTAKLQTMGPIDLRNATVHAALETHLKSLRIETGNLADGPLLSACDAINGHLDALCDALESFQQQIIECDKQISSVIKGIKKFVNNYLKGCGIPYEFEVEENSADSIKTSLIKKKPDGEAISIPQPKASLSFGERNCLCLALFAIEACQSNPDLIILDDPVSSFDSGKRFAMLSLLFGSEKSFTFREKTVILLTHDMSPLIDFVYRKTKGISKDVTAWRLVNKGGCLKEREISHADIRSALAIERSLAMDSSKPLVPRLIHARKYLEMSGKREGGYDLLSSLFHGRPTPTKSDGETALDPETITKGRGELQDLNFEEEYSALLSRLDTESLKRAYKNADSTIYEKMAIARILVDRSKSPNLGRPFSYSLDVIFHIEQETIFNCAFLAEESIPDYIFNYVDGEIKKAFPDLNN